MNEQPHGRVYSLAVQISTLTAQQIIELDGYLGKLWGEENGPDLLGVREPRNPKPSTDEGEEALKQP